MKSLGGFFIGALLVNATVIAQEAGYKSVEVAEGVYSFGGGPFAYYTMFVVSDAGVIVADPTKPIRYVIYSHNHWDHISGVILERTTERA